jgi:hypothetical protein
MKRVGLSVVVAVLVAAAAYAATNGVTSVNVVGYTKVKAPGQEISLKAMSFDAFDQTLLGVFGTNQLNQATPKGGAGVADKIYLWDASVPEYKIYAQDSDGTFYDVADWQGAPVTDKLMTAGTAFWIRSADPEGQTNEITLMGEVVEVVTQAVDMVEGLNLVSYGFSTDIRLPDTDLVNDGAALGTPKGGAGVADKVYIWNGSEYEIYAPDETGTWWNVDSWQTGSPASNLIEIGEGFWFRRGSGTMTWDETNVYLNNLD